MWTGSGGLRAVCVRAGADNGDLEQHSCGRVHITACVRLRVRHKHLSNSSSYCKGRVRNFEHNA